MKTNGWDKGMRIAAIVLVVSLFLCALPQINTEVKAETGTETEAVTEIEIGTETVTEIETETEEKKNLDEYIFSTTAKKIYDALPVSIQDLAGEETGIEILAVKDGEDTVILHAGIDCEIMGKTDGEWKNAGSYTLSVMPKDGTDYIFTEKEINYQIEAFSLTNEAVTLSKDTLLWIGEEIAAEQLPRVTVKNGEHEIPSDNYQTKIERKVQDAGVYTITVEPASGNTNITGSGFKTFEVKYDEEIGEESYSVADGKNCIEKDGLYYYKDASKVVIRPSEGYRILENGIVGGIYQNGNVVLSDGSSDITFRIIKNGGTGREIYISGFVKDVKGPEISFEEDSVFINGSGETWIKSEPRFVISDAGVGVPEAFHIEYHTQDDSSWALFTPSLIEGMESGTKCFFRAVDRLGNETADEGVVTCFVDKSMPYINVEGISFDAEGVAEVCLRKADLDVEGKKTFLTEISDGESGIQSVTVTPDSAVLDQETGRIDVRPLDADVPEFFVMEVTAEDYVGHVFSRRIFIYYDPNAPRIDEIQLNGMITNEIITEKDVIVSAVVEDDILNEKAQIVSVEFVNTKDKEDIIPMKRQGSSNIYLCELKTQDFLEKTCKIKAKDRTGNVAESSDISISIAKKAPTLISVETDEKKNEHGWVNQDVTFSILVSEPENHPKKVNYHLQYQKVENGKTVIEDDSAWNWVMDGDKKAEKRLDESGDYIFYFKEINDAFDGQYAFRVVDDLKNNSAYQCKNIKKDKILPEIVSDSILVKYESDLEQEKGTHNFLEGLKHFFGKKEVTVSLYIPQDKISGVKSIEYIYDAGVGGLEVSEGYTALINGEEYAEFVLKLSKSVAEKLKITKITDYAGNSVTQMNSAVPVAEDDTVIVIDDVSPILNVDYLDDDSLWNEKKGIDRDEDGRERRYYAKSNNDYKEIILTYEERFFEENIEEFSEKLIRPVIKVNGRIVNENSDWVDFRWGDFNPDTKTVTASLKLYYEENEEVEYVITTSYQDGSRNPLVLSDDFWMPTHKSGEFQSGTIVLDDRAPEFSYEIKETPMQHDINGINVYKNRNGNDVTVSFTIDETLDYWHKENMQFLIRDLTHNKVIVDYKGENYFKEWEENLDYHTVSFGFDGEANTAANYRVEVYYKDMAGNVMIGKSGFTLSDGRYLSEEFILDHVAPVCKVGFNKAYRLVDNRNTAVSGDKKNVVPQTGYTAYYQTNIIVEFSIEEAYANPIEEQGKLTSLSDFLFTINGSAENLPEIEWSYSPSEHLYTGRFLLSEEGRYQIGIRYSDVAGNTLVGRKNGVQGAADEIAGGVYRSEILVIDKTAPVIKTVYTDQTGTPIQPVNTKGVRKYFNQNTYLEIAVEETNLRYSELKDSLSKISVYTVEQQDKQVKSLAKEFIDTITEKTIADSVFWSIPLTTEANYDIPLAVEDLAGNQTIADTEFVCVDVSNPTDIKFAYSVEKSSYIDIVNYRNFGFAFADHKLTVTASANDAISGIQYIEFTVIDELGKVQVFTREYNPYFRQKASIALPLSGSNFKGSVNVKVMDFSVNISERDQEQIVETKAQHKKNSRAEITTKTAPSRSVDGEDYYNSDVEFNLTLEDTYSGIGSYEYTAGAVLKGAKDYIETAGDDMESEAEQKIVHKISKNLTLTSHENNKNEVLVAGSFVDNAGHKSKVKETYNIDVTKPVIDVTYDLNDPLNEEYFQDTRTATVVITERNFDEKDVEFQITNSDGKMPNISDFTSSGSGDETKHTATVVFLDDGDYTFSLSFVDLAGNEAVYENEDKFTIDKTLPEYVVTYDNDNSVNDYYYDAPRTATIDILEHNFDPSSITATITKDNASAGTPSFSGWSQNGDHNTATVTFDTDGEYTFTFSGVDLAGNEIEEYAQDHFVVDITEPEIEIFDIENMSANNGNVQPKIRYSDTNFDANATIVEMTGFHNGKIDIGGTTSVYAGGVEIQMDDFAYLQEMDDLYTMHAIVYDLAGNSSEAEVKFSVNRFGSVYTFDSDTNDLVGDNGRYYTKEEKDIVITETNVDTLGFQEITCNFNGELSTLEEGEDYSVKQSGSEESWKQYTYTLKKTLFEKEGTYTITIYSEDQAENKSDNSTKGKKIEFVVDKTRPSILVSGVENDGQYREDRKTVTVDVEDNVRLADVIVDLNGKAEKYSLDQIAEADGKINLSIPSNNHWQTLEVSAYDAAENEMKLNQVRFLITANFLIQFRENKPIFYGSIGGTAAFIIIVYVGITALRRKKRKVQE